MRLISNVLVVTGILIGFPLLFYFAFHGADSRKFPDIEEADSGYHIKMEEKTCDLEEYIVGVLPSQIESDSAYEAVKAQAVIVRTSILRQMDGKKEINGSELEESFIPEEKQKEEYGEKEYANYRTILEKAVMETGGIVMKAAGEYIVPLYHQISVGTTVSAKELYGKDISYLQSVDSGQDIEAADFMKAETWEYEDALELIRKQQKNTGITEKQLKKEIAITSKTKSGYVKKLKVGEEELSGETWQEIFGLDSTNFYIEDYENQLRMICLGKGHGMGLSQYGAEQMAESGASYKKILKHYYSGIKFARAYEQTE